MKKQIFLLILVANLITGSLTAQQNITSMAVIPSGEYVIGKDSDQDAVYSPAHVVIIDSFFIDIHEVTNAQYYEFCMKTDRELPEFWGIEKYKSSLDYPDYPVLGVSKNDAMAYAEHCGKRLPTEAEWEVAARGGLINKDFTNSNDFKDIIILDSIFELGARSPYAVMLDKPNGYGIYGMCCNAREWVNDIYDKDYYKISPIDNPQGPETGRLSVVRGGGWRSGTSCKKVFVRNALRGSWVDVNIGFRCAKDIN